MNLLYGDTFLDFIYLFFLMLMDLDFFMTLYQTFLVNLHILIRTGEIVMFSVF